MRRGASASSGRSIFGASPANGLPNRARCSAARSRAGRVSTLPSSRRNSRSRKGRR